MSAIFDYMGYMRVYTNPLNTARYVTATFSTDTELHSFFCKFFPPRSLRTATVSASDVMTSRCVKLYQISERKLGH